MKNETIRKAGTKTLRNKMEKLGITNSALTRAQMVEALINLNEGLTTEEDLRQALNPQSNFEGRVIAQTAEFIDITDPTITFEGGDVFSIEGHKVTLDKMGVTYLVHYFYRDQIDEERAYDAFDMGKYELFARLLNEARAVQIASESRKGNRDNFILSVIRGTLKAIFTNYIPFHNHELLTAIRDAGLEFNEHLCFVNHKEMRLHIRSAYEGEDIRSAWYLTVENGETGLRALRFSLSIGIGGYVHTFPVRARKRHLSNIEDVVETLKTVLNELKAIDVDKLLGVQTNDFVLKVAKGIEKVRMSPRFVEIETTVMNAIDAFDAIAELSELSETRGFKGLCNQVLDEVFKKAHKLA